MARSQNKYALLILVCGLLAACGSGVEREAKYPTGAKRSAQPDIYAKPESIFGEDGIKLLGKDGGPGDSVITVNSYLWRAALDTVSFMPLTSVDPFGGVILTDWYAPSESADERYKMNVLVLGSQLRSDGIQVSVFKQQKSRAGWIDAGDNPSMARQLEDTILTRAREIRIQQLHKGEE